MPIASRVSFGFAIIVISQALEPEERVLEQTWGQSCNQKSHRLTHLYSHLRVPGSQCLSNRSQGSIHA